MDPGRSCPGYQQRRSGECGRQCHLQFAFAQFRPSSQGYLRAWGQPLGQRDRPRRASIHLHDRAHRQWNLTLASRPPSPPPSVTAKPVNFVILKGAGSAGSRAFYFGHGAFEDSDETATGTIAAVSFCYGLPVPSPRPSRRPRRFRRAILPSVWIRRIRRSKQGS